MKQLDQTAQKTRTGPDGVRIEHPNGSTEIISPSGQRVIQQPTEIHNPDGTVSKVYPYDGRTETTGFGSEDPRLKEVKYPDGRVETEYLDHHKKTTFPKGDERDTQTVSPDGKIKTTRYRDGHTVTETTLPATRQSVILRKMASPATQP